MLVTYVQFISINKEEISNSKLLCIISASSEENIEDLCYLRFRIGQANMQMKEMHRHTEARENGGPGRIQRKTERGLFGQVFKLRKEKSSKVLQNKEMILELIQNVRPKRHTCWRVVNN